MTKEKELTAEQEKMITNYEIQKEKLLADGYKERQETISVLKANIMAFVTAGPFAVLQVIIWVQVEKRDGIIVDIKTSWVFLGVLLVTIFVHELLHGAGWVMWTERKWQSIQLGMMWKYLTPYCHCKEPLKPKHYLVGGLMPFWVLGGGLFTASLLAGNQLVFLLSVVNVLSAGGDTTIACMLFKYLKAQDNCYILDHPTECGFAAFVKN